MDKTINLGETLAISFDEAFFAAKALFDTFDIDAVIFDFRGRTIRVTEHTTVGDAYDQSLPPAL